ncbi:MAG: GtrA family protein [Brevinematales bacterium]|jgi:putative flippase GtrA
MRKRLWTYLKELYFKIEIFKKIKFLSIGGTTYLLNMSAVYLTHEILRLDSNTSFTISYVIGLIYHFTLNKIFVFQEKKLSRLKYQIIQYLILSLINYLIQLGVLNLFLLLKVSIYIGVSAGIALTLTLTYFIMNSLIFKKNKELELK